MNADAPHRTPVLIVGGGPVGLATAMELSHHGIGCVVVEPRTEVAVTRPRAKTTSARTMELFRRWGLADALRAKAPITVSYSSDIVFCTTATGREITRFTDVLGLDLTGSELAAEPGQQVAQPIVEQALRDALASSPHPRVLYGHRVTDLHPGESHVAVGVRDDDGRTRVIHADYVVGADGARSLVRSAIGARYEGTNAGRPNLSVVFRSRGLADLLPGEPALHHWVLDPAAPGVLGSLDLADTWWAIATGRPDDDGDVDPVAVVRGIVGRDVPVEVLGTDPWQARALLADRYSAGRVFLVGDAAHQNPPWGGHGFNTGIGDAVNLGWKLAAVLQGWAAPELLDSYEAERRPVAATTIDIATANTAALPTDLAAAAVDSAARRALADRIHAAKGAEFYCNGLVLGYAYGPGIGTQTTDGLDFRPRAVPGNRLPHRWIGPGESLYDRLGRGLTLLGDPALAEPFVALAASRNVPLTFVTDVGGPAADAFDVPLVLIRPDQHIAWLGVRITADDAPDVLTRALTGFGSAEPVTPATV